MTRPLVLPSDRNHKLLIYLPIADLAINIFLLLAMGLAVGLYRECLVSAVAS